MGDRYLEVELVEDKEDEELVDVLLPLLAALRSRWVGVWDTGSYGDLRARSGRGRGRGRSR